MIFRKNIVLFSGAFLFLFTFSCTSVKEGDNESWRLTQDELGELVGNARHFLLMGRRKFKLSLDDRYIIKRSKPEIRDHYTGDKEGKISLSWNITGGRRIIAVAEGELLETSRFWRVNVVSRTPQVIFKKPGEEVNVSPESLNLK